MMDRLDELAIFVAILDSGSLAAAARRLHRSAAAVTRSLAALEDRVGLRLVERTTRRLAPTEAGRHLAEQARHLLADYDGLLRDRSAAPMRGLLRVTAPLVFGRRHVTPVVASFLAAYPEMRVELVLNDRNLDLIEEGLDVALRIGPQADSSLIVRRIGDVRRILVASADYLNRRGVPQTPADLAGHQLISGAGPAAALDWQFREGGRDRVIAVTPRLLVNDVEALLAAVGMGLGIGRVLSYQAADALAAGRFYRLLPDYEPASLPVQLAVPSVRHLAPKVRTFLDHAAATLSALDVLRPPFVPASGSP
jgi:DNA-binding transcriptional LysR family regulator